MAQQTLTIDDVSIPKGTLPLSVEEITAFDWDGILITDKGVILADIRSAGDGFHHCRAVGGYANATRKPVATIAVSIQMDAMLESLGVTAGDLQWSRAGEALQNAVVSCDRVTGEIVYFLRAGDFIKIGKTTGTPDHRVSQLKTGCPFPIEVVATTPGGLDVERALHKRFAALRAHGEWFHAAPDLLAHVATIGGAA